MTLANLLVFMSNEKIVSFRHHRLMNRMYFIQAVDLTATNTVVVIVVVVVVVLLLLLLLSSSSLLLMSLCCPSDMPPIIKRYQNIALVPKCPHIL